MWERDTHFLYYIILNCYINCYIKIINGDRLVIFNYALRVSINYDASDVCEIWVNAHEAENHLFVNVSLPLSLDNWTVYNYYLHDEHTTPRLKTMRVNCVTMKFIENTARPDYLWRRTRKTPIAFNMSPDVLHNTNATFATYEIDREYYGTRALQIESAFSELHSKLIRVATQDVILIS